MPFSYLDLSAAGREAVWQRIEAWTAHRWGARPCTFIVETGTRRAWRRPLHPFTVETTEAWVGEEWEPVTLAPDYAGGVQVHRHPRRGRRPARDVVEAYRRLAGHFVAIKIHSPMLGSSRHEQSNGDRSLAVERAPTWTARAMQNSGAADLLRAYRRAP